MTATYRPIAPVAYEGLESYPLSAPDAPVSVTLLVLQPGQRIAAHAHPQRETIVTLGGPLVLTFAGGVEREIDEHEDAAVDIPPGVEHEVHNPMTATTVRLLSIASPGWGQRAPTVVPENVARAISEGRGLSAEAEVDEAETWLSDAGLSLEMGDRASAVEGLTEAAAHILRALDRLSNGGGA